MGPAWVPSSTLYLALRYSPEGWKGGHQTSSLEGAHCHLLSLCLEECFHQPLGKHPPCLCLDLALPSPSCLGFTFPPLSVGVPLYFFGQSLPGPLHLTPAPDLSLLCPQAALQVGGHGERLTQCREVVLTTSKAIPVQVDGEPCKLAASRIRIALRNQATMVQKAKRRSAAPLHSEYVPHTLLGPQAQGQTLPLSDPWFPHPERELTVPLPQGSWEGTLVLVPGQGPC